MNESRKDRRKKRINKIKKILNVIFLVFLFSFISYLYTYLKLNEAEDKVCGYLEEKKEDVLKCEGYISNMSGDKTWMVYVKYNDEEDKSYDYYLKDGEVKLLSFYYKNYTFGEDDLNKSNEELLKMYE